MKRILACLYFIGFCGLLSAMDVEYAIPNRATNVNGGTAGDLLYQSAADTTAFLADGTTTQVLIGGSSAPSWSAAPELGTSLAVGGALTSGSKATIHGVLHMPNANRIDFGGSTPGSYTKIFSDSSSNDMNLTAYRDMIFLNTTGTGRFVSRVGFGGTPGSNAEAYIVHGATAAVSGTGYMTSVSTQTPANTSETILYEYSLPANTLKTNNDCIEIVCGGRTAANGNNKTFTIRFGSSAAGVMDGTIVAGGVTASAANARQWAVESTVCRIGSNSQRVLKAYHLLGTGAGATAAVTPAVTDTAAIIIHCTGTNGTAAAGDILGDVMSVRVLPAP